jgi:subtilisin family serine protease
MGENTRGHEPNHGKEMVRTIAGKAGLAKGADIRMYETPDDGGEPDSSATVQEMIKGGVESLIENPKYIGELVQNAHRHSQRDGMPTLVAISVGDSINDEAQSAAEATLAAKKGTPLYRSAFAILHHAPSDRDYDRLFSHYQSHITQALASPDNARRLESNRGDLTRTVADARADRVLVFFAAGNSYETDQANPPGSSKDTALVNGMIAVGATDPKDNSLLDWSSEGAEIALPGSRMPVGPADRRGRASTVEGTSFAGPDATGLAALMVKAGIRDPDTIERILTSSTVSHRVGGSRPNGALEPNEVAAVIQAALR